MITFLTLTRGTVAHRYDHTNLNEDYEYFINRVGIFLTVLFIFAFHFIVRYFIINISVASFLSEFTLTRKEMNQQKRITLANIVKKQMEKKKLEEEKAK